MTNVLECSHALCHGNGLHCKDEMHMSPRKVCFLFEKARIADRYGAVLMMSLASQIEYLNF